MMTAGKYAELKDRMLHHISLTLKDDDIAVVVLTAQELEILLDAYCDCGSGCERGSCICDNDE